MGHHNIRYVGDPNADAGIWGTPTSVANFCEEDYAVTLYIAEFVNTLTNAAYVYYALQHPPQASAGWLKGQDFMGVSLICIGICSSLFHGTMRQIPQLFDDMSMLLLAGALLYPVYAWNQSPMIKKLVGAFAIISIGGMSIIYARSGDILTHTITFISTITFVWPRALWIVHRAGGFTAEQKKVMMSHFWRALWGMIIAYALWNIDLEMCLPLRAIRARVGLPFAWVLELHGWWHVLTAYGASHFIRLIRLATAVEPSRSIKNHAS